MKKTVWGVWVALMAQLAIAAPPEIAVVRHAAPNLLENPGFEQLDTAGNPVGWEFANMANSDKIQTFGVAEGAVGANALKIVTPGNLPGYWTHRRPVPVREGVTYFASVKFKAAGPRALLWLRTEQYQDGKSSLFPPWSQTEIFTQGDGSQGEELRDELGLFIPPELVRVIGARDWHQFTMEFTVPAGQGIRDYVVRAGVYYGAPGWLMIDDIYFGEAACNVDIRVRGTGMLEALVRGADGTEVARHALEPENSEHSISVALPSSQKSYVLEIKDVDGTIWNQEL